MSCHNSSLEDVEISVQSVLSQTFKMWKLELILDGTTEDFYDKIRRIFKDPRINITYFPENEGLTVRLADAVNDSESKYIARIDTGDYWHNEKLKLQVEFLEKNVNVNLVATQVTYFSENENSAKVSSFATDDVAIRRRIHERKGVFEHSTILFRNNINYRKRFRYSQDLDLYIRVSSFSKLACLDIPLCYCRRNLNGISVNKKPEQLFYINLCYIDRSKQFVEDLPPPARKLKRIDWMWSYARYFYIKFIHAPTIWHKLLYLSITVFLYPPLGLYYLRRLM